LIRQHKQEDNKGRLNQVWKLLAAFAGALVILRLALPVLVFMPTAMLTHTPAATGLPFDDVTLTASDGVTLHGWWVPAPNSRATLLFFHGNAGNISHRLDSIKIFHNLELSVFIIDYRGYGQSDGRASIKGTGLDALAAWQWLTEGKKIPAEEIVVFGRSLGGAIAVELTRSTKPGALILESTFSSLADMAPFFLLPVARLVTWGAWNSVKTAGSITIPTLCIHSSEDDIVPYRQGRRLYDALASEKTFVDIHGDHNGGFFASYDIYVSALDKFLTRYFGPKGND
jgi:fermentation-respiration switch protein FrsA (DUF1100 family)